MFDYVITVLLLALFYNNIYYVESISIYDLVLDSVNCSCERSSDLNVSKTKIFLYNFQTNSNDSYTIDTAAKEILSRKDFDKNQCMHIFVPGFANTNEKRPAQITRCLLSRIKCNNKKPLVLIVDHSYYTNSDNILQELDVIDLYKKSVNFTKSIGVKLGGFVTELLNEVDRNLINIMGHSLGGHMVGYLGETVQKQTGTLLKSIFPVDAAKPCYQNCLAEHVKSGQAEVVVTFHCNSDEIGTSANLADYDLYAGNGKTQKGCSTGGLLDLVLGFPASFCSHVKCVVIAQNSALPNSEWNAVKCSNSKDFDKSNCGKNEKSLFGYGKIPTSSKGVYYFKVNKTLSCDIGLI